MDEGLVVVKPAAAATANTTFVYKGGEPPPEVGPGFDRVDIEESRRKLGLLESANKRAKAKEPAPATKHKPLLPRGPVTEKTRSGVAPNGSAMMGEEPPTELISELQPIGEETNPAIEVTASQMIESEVDAEVVGELDTLGSGDIEPVPVEPERAEITEEEPIPLPSSKSIEPLKDPAESKRLPTPAPTLLSAAELSEPKAIGGVQTLPAEHGERPSSKPGRGAFRPKGSWPTEDLVLPSKAAASGPLGFGDDLRRAPTAVIRTRGVFSNEFDLPDRPGVMTARETDIIRPRSPSELGAPPPRSDTLPIDRANTVLDPAEAANRSVEVRLRPKRSMIPLAAGAVILTIAAAAIALPRLDSDGSKEIRRPVLIQAQPEREQPEDDVAALDTLPDGDAPEEKEPENAEALGKAAALENAAALEKAEREKAELAEKAAREKAEREEVEREKAEVAKEKERPRSKIVEVKADAELDEDVLPEGDDPDDDKSKKKKKTQRKRSSAKTAPKKEQPDKLERGTLIDPFAE
jgi:hypothetical protein